VDPEAARTLLARYASATPRYTSYPTAPAWSELGPDALREALGRVGGPGRERVSLYVHVPFCRSLCHFCACNRMITSRPELPEQWLASIAREVRSVREHLGAPPRVTQVHWGGGTPTHLSPGQIHRVAGILEDAFEVASDAERSIEVDPRVTTCDHLAALREHGFARMSLGVQDFDPRVQEAIHRIQPAAEVARLVDRARKAGFRGIGFDLIYGLPFQTPESFGRTLDRVLDLAPDRVALYGYAHVTWVAKQQRGFERKDLPEPARRLEILVQAIGRFLEAGYVHVGMDHFARPDDPLAVALRDGTLRRNFMGYTTQAGVDLLGFGPSAITALQDLYAQSHRALHAWDAAVQDCGLATFRGHRLDADDQERAWLISRILCQGRIDVRAHRARFGAELWERFARERERLAPLEADGLVTLDADGSLCVTPLGRLVVRHVATVFDAYLAPAAETAAPRFSQTV